MSVLSYLQDRARNAVLSTTEESSINTSIATLKTRLASHFGSNINEQFRFGSSTRGTILPRVMDEHSDIDYMVVFADGGYSPQTYLDRLRRFVESYYSTSEIKQSSPTIVLQLNHIKFDLVPALKAYSGYQIPDGSNNWQGTNPNDFNATLTSKNNAELSMIKPTIRLAKFWNANAGYVFDSFSLEKWIVSQSFSTVINQRDYLFRVFDNLGTNKATQWRRERIERAKTIVKAVRDLERDEYPNLAEAEVKKLIPA